MKRGAVGVWLALLALAGVAHAHAAGTASINRYLDFEYQGDGRFRVAYLLDFAEAPAYAEIDALDANHDGAVSAEEQRRYLDARLPPLVDAWLVEVDGERVRPTIVASHVDVSPGQGGLETLRIECELSLVGSVPAAGKDLVLHVRDDTFASYPGWREIREGDATLRDGTAPSQTVTTGDPADAGVRRVSDATFRIRSPARAPDVAPPASSHSPVGFWLAGAAIAVAALVGWRLGARPRG